MPNYRFAVLKGTWAVARMSPSEPIPAWASSGSGFTSITRSDEELSIVCPEPCVPPGVRVEAGWSVIKLLGPFPFSQTGVLASFAFPLAANSISIFAISTFDTDYILVRPSDLAKACEVLARSGHSLASTAVPQTLHT